MKQLKKSAEKRDALLPDYADVIASTGKARADMDGFLVSSVSFLIVYTVFPNNARKRTPRRAFLQTVEKPFVGDGALDVPFG